MCILWVGINDVMFISIFFFIQMLFLLDFSQWSNSNKPSECINYYVSISGWNGKPNRRLGSSNAIESLSFWSKWNLETVQCFCRVNHKNRTKLFSSNWLEFFSVVYFQISHSELCLLWWNWAHAWHPSLKATCTKSYTFRLIIPLFFSFSISFRYIKKQNTALKVARLFQFAIESKKQNKKHEGWNDKIQTQ